MDMKEGQTKSLGEYPRNWLPSYPQQSLRNPLK